MSYTGYGSTSWEAERQRQLAKTLMPKIGGPVAGIGGGVAQLAQALVSRRAGKKADKLEQAHREKMAAALKGATAGMTPEQQAFAQAFPKQFAQLHAQNAFPNQMAQKRLAMQQQSQTFNQGIATRGANRADQQFQHTQKRDQIQDQRYADQTQYQRGRDQVSDQRYDQGQQYQQGRDAKTDAFRQQQLNTAAAKAAKTDLGRTPIYLRGPDGQVSIGQLGQGQIVPANVAPGMSVIDPQQKSFMQQQGRSQGKIQGETRQNLPVVETNAARAIKTVDQLLNHKGIDAGTGFSAKIPAIPGSDKYAFNVANKQAQGQVFLQAYEALKGGGVITEIEGLKGEQALARMDAAQSRSDYEAALRDYKGVIENGLAAARSKAGVGNETTENKTLVYDPATGDFK